MLKEPGVSERDVSHPLVFVAFLPAEVTPAAGATLPQFRLHMRQVQILQRTLYLKNKKIIAWYFLLFF